MARRPTPAETRPPLPAWAVTEGASEGRALSFVLEALAASGCCVLSHSGPALRPIAVSYLRPSGERVGIVVYAAPVTESPGTLAVAEDCAERPPLLRDPAGG